MVCGPGDELLHITVGGGVNNVCHIVFNSTTLRNVCNKHFRPPQYVRVRTCFSTSHFTERSCRYTETKSHSDNKF